MTSAQCRMARAAIEMGVRELAEAAKVSTNTVTRFERRRGAARAPTVDACSAAPKCAGVEFTNGDQPGVRVEEGSIATASIKFGKNIRRLVL